MNPGNYRVYLSNDFEQFMNRQYYNCTFYKRNKGEILSLGDQAMATNSFRFIRWLASSWSGRVQTLRQMKHHKLEPVSVVSLLEEKFGLEVPSSLVQNTYDQVSKTLQGEFHKLERIGRGFANYFKNVEDLEFIKS